MEKTRAAILAAPIALAMLLMVGTGSAHAEPVYVTFVNAGSVPQGSKLVLNITYNVTTDEDSGFVGCWALDTYTKHVQTWEETNGNFYVVTRYDGTFSTFAEALSP